MSDYRFDRTAFKMQTFKEADRAKVFDKSISYAERLHQPWYLISQAYGFSMSILFTEFFPPVTGRFPYLAVIHW